MAPEQIEAFLNPDLWANVGAGADIYSLGLVLRELLTGQMPDLPREGAAGGPRDERPARPQAAARRGGSPIQSGDSAVARSDRREMPGA